MTDQEREERHKLQIMLAAGAVMISPLPSMMQWQSNFLARAFLWLLLSACLCLWRVLRGPTAASFFLLPRSSRPVTNTDDTSYSPGPANTRKSPLTPLMQL